MYGAIIGDLAGSIYEYEQLKEIKPVIIDKLIEDNAFFSDDTILTMLDDFFIRRPVDEKKIEEIDVGVKLFIKRIACYNFEIDYREPDERLDTFDIQKNNQIYLDLLLALFYNGIEIKKIASA